MKRNLNIIFLLRLARTSFGPEAGNARAIRLASDFIYFVSRVHRETTKQLPFRKYLCLSTIILCFLSTGCDKGDSPKIEFVFPDDTEGVFLVYEDKHEGDVVQGNIRSLQLEVPESGLVPVSDIDIFMSWHQRRARYENGTEVSYHQQIEDAKARFYGLGYVPEEGIYFYIGDEGGYKEIKKTFDLTTLSVGLEE